MQHFCPIQMGIMETLLFSQCQGDEHEVTHTTIRTIQHTDCGADKGYCYLNHVFRLLPLQNLFEAGFCKLDFNKILLIYSRGLLLLVQDLHYSNNFLAFLVHLTKEVPIVNVRTEFNPHLGQQSLAHSVNRRRVRTQPWGVTVFNDGLEEV